MKNFLFNVIFSFALLFILSLNVSADCSYKERMQLLDEAKEVEVFFEPSEREKEEFVTNPNSGETTLEKITYKYFKMNFANMSDNLFLDVKNTSTNESFTIDKYSFENGMYIYSIEDVFNVVNYEVSFYSTLENCYAYNVYTKIYKKPKFNTFSLYDICSNEIAANTKYCEKYIESDFNMDDVSITEYLNKLIDKEVKNNQEEKEKDFVDYIKVYWYIPTIAVVLIVLVIITILIVKKRGELR